LANVSDLTQLVYEFYRREFWNKADLDAIVEQRKADEIFIFGTNAGMPIAIKKAQKLVGVTIDGDVGPKTIKAINDYDVEKFDVFYDIEEKEHYDRLIYLKTNRSPISKANTLNKSIDSCIIIDNSNKDYDLFLDYDGSVQQGWKWLVNDNQYYDGHFQEEFLLQTEFSYNGFVKLPLLSYTKLVVENINPDLVRFNGFLIRLIGDSVATTNAYNDGYQEGLTNGVSAMPIQNLFTAIFGGVAAIFNVNIFGAISLGTIILAPIAVSLLWFILGIISGVGGKK
jgi:hypothetical protein